VAVAGAGKRLTLALKADVLFKSERRPYGAYGCNVGFVNPTLKRGANEHCAYGAGDERLQA